MINVFFKLLSIKNTNLIKKLVGFSKSNIRIRSILNSSFTSDLNYDFAVIFFRFSKTNGYSESLKENT